jgi:hypothetical protein
MSCDEVLAALTQGRAEPDDATRERLAEHALSCEECRDLLAATREFEEALRDPGTEDRDPPEVRDAILAAAAKKAAEIRRANAARGAAPPGGEGDPPRRGGLPPLGYIALAFALGAVVAGAVFWASVSAAAGVDSPPPRGRRDAERDFAVSGPR